MAYTREIAWVAVAQGAAFVGGLAVVKTTAAALGPAEYGKLSVALAIISISQICFYGSISQTASRFLAFASSHNLLKRYEISLGKFAVLAAASIALFGVVASALGVQQLLPVPAALLCAYAIINGFQAIAIAVCNAARKRELVAITLAAEALVRPILILLITHAKGATAYHALLAYVISTCLICLVIVALWSAADWSSVTNYDSAPKRSDEIVTSRQLTWLMTTYTSTFVMFGILGALGSNGERLLLAKWVDWSDVGVYTVMAQLVMAPNVLFTNVINQFYFPMVFQFDPDGRREVIRSFHLYMLISVSGVAAITAVTSVFGSFLISVFATRAFLGHEHLLWLLGMSAGLFCVGQQLVLPGLRLGKPAVYMPAKFVISVALLGLSAVLVPMWGVDGMGWASLISSITYLCAIMLANIWLERDLKQSTLRMVQL
jgi:O-antigen/teichoic acid export membrane protein